MGLVGYYQSFVPKFSSLASPLSNLIKKGQSNMVQWFEAAEQAFQALKQVLTSLPVLRNPNFDRPFIVHMDASETSLGAILSQTIKREHPLLYVSRKLTPAKQCYVAVEVLSYY